VTEATYALHEAIQGRASPKQLRRLFILLVRNDYPVGVAFDQFCADMIDEKWKGDPPSKKLQLLECLQTRLHADGGRTLSQLDISVPEGFATSDSELRRARMRQFMDEQIEEDIATVRTALQTFTTEQRKVYDEILEACD